MPLTRVPGIRTHDFLAPAMEERGERLGEIKTKREEKGRREIKIHVIFRKEQRLKDFWKV